FFARLTINSDDFFFFLRSRPPPRSPLFSYTTLFRSRRALAAALFNFAFDDDTMASLPTFPSGPTTHVIATIAGAGAVGRTSLMRSEERRVGKESRTGLSPAA